MKPCCHNCRFWDDSPSRNMFDELVPLEGMVEGTILGQCRRYPPSIPFEGEVNAEWPETYQSGWCGEHQAGEQMRDE